MTTPGSRVELLRVGADLVDDAIAEDLADAPALRAAFGRPTSTDGTNGLPAPAGVGLEFVITATGLDDIRFNGSSL